jgi:signal transduction histidine kinase/CheY-like chemotaxis protein
VTPVAAADSAGDSDPIRTEAIRTLYLQLRNSTAAAAIVTLYMVVTAWPHSPHRLILTWLAVQLATQVAREALLQAYRRAAPAPDQLPRWAFAYACYMGSAGLIWGSTVFLFARPDAPITVALTLCGLYGIAGGSVPGNAYNPPGLYAFVGLIFACVMARMMMIGTVGYPTLGIASVGYAAILILFCRVQARTIRDGFRIRFENRALVAALTVEKAAAEEARRAAEQANLAKSQFLAAASHDLRQPLYALGLFSASLEDLKLDTEGRRVVGNIQDNIAALESLFDGLLDVSKLEAGAVQPRFSAVHVDELFDRLSHYFRPLAAERGLDLRLRSGGEIVWSDPALLEQVLSNLVSNALRCTPRGAILIAARQRAQALRFEVWDTGVGIADADLTRIFDEFVQVGNPERDRRKGLGLGLSIARRSVALLGAEIQVRSRPGRGSCFLFAQPLSPDPTRQKEQPILTPSPRAGRSVLIVDDDRNVQNGLAELLGRWGVAFEIFGDADSALRRIEDGARPGLLLSDYRLPGDLNGLDLIVAVRALDLPDMPDQVLVTGDVDPGLIAIARDLDVALLTKPLRSVQLRALLGLS